MNNWSIYGGDKIVNQKLKKEFEKIKKSVGNRFEGLSAEIIYKKIIKFKNYVLVISRMN